MILVLPNSYFTQVYKIILKATNVNILIARFKSTYPKGTDGYMAPEVVKGVDAATPSSDLYSLGITVYQMITGADIYENVNESKIMKNIPDANLAKVSPPPPPSNNAYMVLDFVQNDQTRQIASS